MAGGVAPVRLADLTRVVPKATIATGEPGPLFTWLGPFSYTVDQELASYPPSDGAPPRLIAMFQFKDPKSGRLDRLETCCLGVWDSDTGAFLRALQSSQPKQCFRRCITYQRPSDGRPRIAAGGLHDGVLCIWDGDDYSILYEIMTAPERAGIRCLMACEEPLSGSLRLVTG
jgi:hypothetical protein